MISEENKQKKKKIHLSSFIIKKEAQSSENSQNNGKSLNLPKLNSSQNLAKNSTQMSPYNSQLAKS